MQSEFWLDKWAQNQIGFHQTQVHASLPQFWPVMPKHSRVLVPLCGKSIDVMWLAQQGYEVTGVELSEKAILAFFQEQQLSFDKLHENGLDRYVAHSLPLIMVCGDFFSFTAAEFDALYDRAALVALPREMRLRYTHHCQSLLKPDAQVVLITLLYNPTVFTGPPFSISDEEISLMWGNVIDMAYSIDILDKEPHFRDKGLGELIETTWVTSL